ncbi:MAG TPA: repressor LexA [Fibrobacteres bacterium]|nr:repressor LexA [Fibrobacterota bacterium]
MESGKERKALTSRQREVFEFIKERIQSTSRPPTLREIGVRFGISSTNGVRSILHALAKKQYIERAPKLSRGIDLPEVEKMAPDYREDVVEVPVLGRVAAGTPILAVENLEGTVVVDREFLMRQDGVFALKVTGDSMKDAGIMDGDMVFARQQRVADPGQIVIALIGEETTVKYFFPEGSYVRLQPANDAYRPIIVDANMPELSILGRVIGVMRKYN